jgi:hypothetical protein
VDDNKITAAALQLKIKTLFRKAFQSLVRRDYQCRSSFVIQVFTIDFNVIVTDVVEIIPHIE